MDAALLARGTCGTVKDERQWRGNTAMQESLDE